MSVQWLTNACDIPFPADGLVYSWGFGGDGQLGHGDQAVQPVPRLITSLSKEYVVKVAAGKVHSVCLTRESHSKKIALFSNSLSVARKPIPLLVELSICFRSWPGVHMGRFSRWTAWTRRP